MLTGDIASLDDHGVHVVVDAETDLAVTQAGLGRSMRIPTLRRILGQLLPSNDLVELTDIADKPQVTGEAVYRDRFCRVG